MKKKYTRPLLTIAAGICIAGALVWANSQPALLENDEPSSPLGAGMVLIPEEDVPLAGTPEAPDTENAENPEENTEIEDTVDLYEGLNETQIKYVDEVLKLVNEARAEAGVPALELDASLRKAAQVRAAECVETFSHTRPNGTSYKTAITEAGVESKYTGENVATGHTSPKQVVDRLMKSEGHRANILNANFTKIGIGLEKNVGNRYGGYSWSQLFVK